MNAHDILTRNTPVSFASLSRLGKLRRIESYFDCFGKTSAALLDHPRFEQVVCAVESRREAAAIPAGCPAHRNILAQEMSQND